MQQQRHQPCSPTGSDLRRTAVIAVLLQRRLRNPLSDSPLPKHVRVLRIPVRNYVADLHCFSPSGAFYGSRPHTNQQVLFVPMEAGGSSGDCCPTRGISLPTAGDAAAKSAAWQLSRQLGKPPRSQQGRLHSSSSLQQHTVPRLLSTWQRTQRQRSSGSGPEGAHFEVARVAAAIAAADSKHRQSNACCARRLVGIV